MSLDPVSQVLLPPEERLKQRIRRILAATGLLILLGLTGWAVRHFWHRHSVEANAQAAGATGRPDAIQDAIDTLDSGELLGLRARLQAMLALAGEGSIEEAETAYAEVPEDDAHEASERLKAGVYIALAKGNAAEAIEAADRLISSGDFAAETAHAKSRAQIANGLNATAEASRAAELDSGPRYAALRATALVAMGDVDGALAAVEGHEDPATTLARARALHAGYREGGEEAAQSVVAAEDATRSEKAWAEALLAAAAARKGAGSEARTHASGALEQAPPGDEGFRYFVAEALTTVGATAAAREAIEGLDRSAPVPDPARRGRVLAALALESGDAAEALRLLDTVVASPEALLLVGDARQAAGQLDAARSSYDAAAQSANHRGLAEAARARLELEDGEDEAALAHARAALEASPRHPRVAPAVVAALLANDEKDEAARVADAALESRPEDVRLLAAKAHVLLAKEDWDEALGVLRHAVERDDTDAQLLAELGDAARGAERFDEAADAYGRALALDEGHASALRGLFQLQVATHALEPAASTWEKLDEGDVRIDRATAVARARYLVDSGAGEAGRRELTRLSRRRDLRRDAEMRFLMAENLLQLENYNRAFAMFVRARALDGDDVRAYLGQALAQVRAGRMNRATEALRSAADASQPEDAAEDATPPARSLPRYLVARGWIEANLGRFPEAGNYADRALEADPNDTDAHELRGHVDARTRRSASEHLRAAFENVPVRPWAMGKLAIRLGANEEGCELARRYREAAPRGDLRDDIGDLIERCEEAQEE